MTNVFELAASSSWDRTAADTPGQAAAKKWLDENPDDFTYWNSSPDASTGRFNAGTGEELTPNTEAADQRQHHNGRLQQAGFRYISPANPTMAGYFYRDSQNQPGMGQRLTEPSGWEPYWKLHQGPSRSYGHADFASGLHPNLEDAIMNADHQESRLGGLSRESSTKHSVVTDMYSPPREFDSGDHDSIPSGGVFSLWHQDDPAESAHHITATYNDGIVGHFYWGQDNGRILAVHVHPDFQRMGLATMMYDSARKLSSDNGFVSPVHSDRRSQTPEGAGWATSVDQRQAAAKPAKKPAKPRKPEEVWYDVHKHPEGVPGGMGLSPQHHLRNRGWQGHEINEGSGKKTIHYRNVNHPDFSISYGGGSGVKPDHNFRVLYVGTNSNIPKVTRARSVAEAMNQAESLHKLNTGLVVQPLTHGAAVAKPLDPSDIPDVPQTPEAPARDMDVADNYPDFPSQPTHTERWRNPNRNFQLHQIPDPPNFRASSWDGLPVSLSVRETGENWEDE